MKHLARLVLGAAVLLTGLGACAPRLMAVGEAIYEPRVDIVAASTMAVMPDGARLPLRVFQAKEPRAIIVALHGFNDYGASFEEPGPGPWLAAQGITLYAMDQRGFGRAPGRGLWAGDTRMAEDAATFVRLARERHPGLPVYLLGTSMGGAVAMRSMTLAEPPEVDGLILVAPAVWGWKAMNDFYGAVLWAAARLAPSYTLTGRGLEIMPSDNIEMLRALGRDPLVIKGTQIGTIYGLVNLMESAYDAASHIRVPVLLLYGAKDEIVPAPPVDKVRRAMLAAGTEVTNGCYAEGYHMLLRDLQRETVWRDIASWVEDRTQPLPSGETDPRHCGAVTGD
jgi:acylglycerol lipase